MDDLLDLDLSAPAQHATGQNTTKLGPQAAYGGGRTTFDYLSSMRSANTPSPGPSSRSSSPFASSSSTAAPARTSPVPSRPVAGATTAQGASGGDAFSSLFGTSSSSNAANGKMSMAERLAQENATRFGSSTNGYGVARTALSPNGRPSGGSRTRSVPIVIVL